MRITGKINCRHYTIPYVKGRNSVPSNPLPNLTPQQAVEHEKIEQKQRAMERSIRQAKKQLKMAQRLNDEQGQEHYKALIRARQARVRALVKQHDFLYRDYEKEQYRL